MVTINLTEEQAKLMSLELIGAKNDIQEHLAKHSYEGDFLEKQVKKLREVYQLIDIVIEAERTARA